MQACHAARSGPVLIAAIGLTMECASWQLGSSWFFVLDFFFAMAMAMAFVIAQNKALKRAKTESGKTQFLLILRASQALG